MFVVSRVRELVRSAASLVSTTECDHKEAGQGAPSGTPRSPGSTCPHGVLLPVPSFQIGSTHWQPATTVLQTDSARVQLVDRDALLQWPVLPTAGRDQLCRRRTAWFVSTTPLRLGDPLFAPYGSGSSHFHEIRADAARRAQRTSRRAPKGSAAAQSSSHGLGCAAGERFLFVCKGTSFSRVYFVVEV